jgi:acetylornithine/N-succinyldiaminopimelate aminotransferase
VLRTLTADGFLEAVQDRGNALAAGLRAISAEFALGEVRASGLLLALELGRDIAHDVVIRARDKGLLLNAPRPQCLRLMPALNTTEAEVVTGLGILREVLVAVV